MKISISIHFPENNNLILLYGWIILHCVNIPWFLYPFFPWWARRLITRLLWKLPHEHEVQLSLLYTDLHSFGYIPRWDTAQSYDRYIFSYFRNFHADFHTSYTNLHSH
jgi:hypothetical protein